MVNNLNNKLEEIVSFFGLEVQNEMKVFVQTHTNSKCDTQFSYNSFLNISFIDDSKIEITKEHFCTFF